MRGRKPKPKAILTMDGSSVRRPDEPEVPPGDVVCPAELTGDARVEWDRIAPVLSGMGVLTHADQALLAAYCLAWGRMLHAERELAKTGEVVKSPSGYPIQNPWLAVCNRAGKDMKGYAEQLGLSPTARGRVSKAPAAKKNPFDEFLNRSKKKGG